MKPLFCAAFACLGLFMSISCHKAATPRSPDKEIDGFSLEKADGTTFTISDLQVTTVGGPGMDSFLVTIPAYMDKTALIPVFTFKGESVSPSSGAALDFSAPVVFTVTAEDGSQVKYAVVVKCRGAIYFGTDENRFIALDAGTGNLIWQDSVAGKYNSFTGAFSYNIPQLANGIIYATNSSGTIFGFDPVDGKIKSQFRPGASIQTTAAIDNGTLYVASVDQKFYAIDVATGSTKWTVSTGGSMASGATAGDGAVYFGANYMYALDAATGLVKWKFFLNSGTYTGNPLLTNGVVYVGSDFDSLYALDAATGNVKWRAKADYSLAESTAAIGDGNLYIGAQTAGLLAYDASTGRQLWKVLPGAGITSQPVVYNNTVCVTADDGHLYGVNAQTGVVVWITYGIYTSGGGVMLANGILYLGSGGLAHYFYAIDPADGGILWQFNTGNASILSRQALYLPGN